jgi:hypothetical protein
VTVALLGDRIKGTSCITIQVLISLYDNNIQQSGTNVKQLQITLRSAYFIMYKISDCWEKLYLCKVQENLKYTPMKLT